MTKKPLLVLADSYADFRRIAKERPGRKCIYVDRREKLCCWGNGTEYLMTKLFWISEWDAVRLDIMDMLHSRDYKRVSYEQEEK